MKTRNVSVGHGCPPMTKYHNSCKTCNIAKSLWSSPCHVGHCVWVWTKYIKGCRRSCHRRFRVVCTYGTYGEVQLLMPTHNFMGA